MSDIGDLAVANVAPVGGVSRRPGHAGAAHAEKVALIVPQADVVGLHLALWCSAPQVGEFARVKP